jgi:hypothetical protein
MLLSSKRLKQRQTARKTKGARMPEDEKTVSSKAPRSFSWRAERALKDANRLLEKSPDSPLQERVMAQLEEARAWALLQLAEDLRQNRKN